MRLGRRSIALVVGAVLIALSVPHAAVRADEVPDAGCSVAGGALSIGSADNGDGDFTVFGLFDANGERLARQYIPIYNPDASAELMLTPVGSGTTVHSVKCLAEESLRRCNDPQWEPIDEGVVVQLNGFLLGADYAIVSAKGRYKSAEGAPAISLDGTALGFVLDEQPVEWTALYDSRDQGSVAFFAIAHGEHKLTLGARDPSTQAFLPEERVCFRT